MPDKPTKPGFKKPATPKTAPSPRRKSKEPDAGAVRQNGPRGGGIILRDLAGQAGLPLVGTRAVVGRKKIHKSRLDSESAVVEA